MQQILIYLITLLLLAKAQYSAPVPKTQIYLTGDIMLGRSVMTQAYAKKDFAFPFRYTAEKLNSADIVFSNLETPILEKCPEITNNFIFCADKKMVEGLKIAGINVVNLANNHTLNMGRKGLEETKRILTENNIKWVGDGNLEVVTNDGIKFGFLGFDYVSKRMVDLDLKLISESKEKVDVLITAVHWGLEYNDRPSDSQYVIAKRIIQAGADVIAGHHPHWVQKMELINNKPVFYSLGNFVFDQMWSEETKNGMVGELNFEGKNLISTKSLPIYMRTFATPEWVE